MGFKPLHSLVLIEKLDKEIEKKSAILMPGSHEGRFWKVKVIEVGFNVEHLQPGDICYCNPLPELDDIKAFDNPNYRLINFGNILGRFD